MTGPPEGEAPTGYPPSELPPDRPGWTNPPQRRASVDDVVKRCVAAAVVIGVIALVGALLVTLSTSWD